MIKSSSRIMRAAVPKVSYVVYISRKITPKSSKIKASVPKPLLSTNKYAILSLVGIPTKDKG